MALDPIIAGGFAPPKIDDPLDQMGKVMTNALAMEKMGALGQTRRNAMMVNNAATEAGGDREKMRKALIAAGGYGALQEQEEKWGALDKDSSTTNKAKVEGLAAHRKMQADVWKNVRDVSQLKPALIQIYSNPLAYELYGGQDKAGQAFMQDAAEGQRAATEGPEAFANFVRKRALSPEHGLEQSFQLIEQEGNQIQVANDKYGAGGQGRIVGTYGKKPHSAGVNINMPGANKMADVVGEGLGKEYLAKRAYAAAAPGNIANFTRGIGLVDKAFTGFWSDGSTTASSAFKVNPEALQATQELKQILSTDMFQNIAALRAAGVTLGAITEKEFAQLQATVPNIKDSPATIKAWMKRAINAQKLAMADLGKFKQEMANAPGAASTNESFVVPQSPAAPSLPVDRGTAFTDLDGEPIPDAAIAKLRANKTNPVFIKSFEKHFGPGKALLILNGGSPNGDRPLP